MSAACRGIRDRDSSAALFILPARSACSPAAGAVARLYRARARPSSAAADPLRLQPARETTCVGDRLGADAPPAPAALAVVRATNHIQRPYYDPARFTPRDFRLGGRRASGRASVETGPCAFAACNVQPTPRIAAAAAPPPAGGQYHAAPVRPSGSTSAPAPSDQARSPPRRRRRWRQEEDGAHRLVPG